MTVEFVILVIAVTALIVAIVATGRPRVTIVGEQELRKWSESWGRTIIDMSNRTIDLRNQVMGLDMRLLELSNTEWEAYVEERISALAECQMQHEERTGTYACRVAEAVERIERLEHGFIAATAPMSVEPEAQAVIEKLRAEVGVIRTTSGERSEVRNVDGED